MSFPAISRPVRIFYSYAVTARKDKNLFSKLKSHLATLRHQKLIDDSYDSESVVRGDIEHDIDTSIKNANIIILLLSPEYFNSDRCFHMEMQRALERSKANDARLIPVRSYPVEWKGTPLDGYTYLPSDGKAVSEHSNIDITLQEIANRIEQFAKELAEAPSVRSRSEPQFPLDNIPYGHNPFFTDRETTLAMLHNYFTLHQTPHQTPIQALNGLAGIGKTQIAVEYAHFYKHEYQVTLWLDATPRDLSGGIGSLADLLSFSSEDRTDEQHLLSALKRWLQTNDKWLFILDNLEDLNLISSFIPVQSNGHVLVTTLSRASGPLAHPVPVAEMEPDESILFLLRRARIIGEQDGRDTVSERDYSQALSIVQAVDGLSLALDQAGAYIEETGCGLARYLNLYPQQKARLLAQRGKLIHSHPESVDVTFSLIFQRIKEEYPAALDLLYLFAFLNHEAIPEEMIEQGASALDGPLHALATDNLALDEAIALLLRFSLVQRHKDTTMLSIHRVVQAILQEKLTKQRRKWSMQVVRLVNHVFPQAEFTNWSDCERYLPQARRCAELITRFRLTQKEAAPLLQRLGNYCYQRGYYQEAEKYLTVALQLYEQGIQPDHPDTALVLNNLALLYKDWGKYQQAEELLLRALRIDKQTVGPEHPDAAVSLNNLALVYDAQGKSSLAESLHQQAFSIEEHTLSDEHPDWALSLNIKARWSMEQGDYQRAEELYLRALAIQQRSVGPQDPATAQTLNNLAGLYEVQGKYAEAEALYQQARTIYEQALGLEHPDTANVLNNLAYLFCQQGKYQGAERLYQQALSIYEHLPGPTHPGTAHVLNNLGRLYHLMKKDECAELLLRRGLDVCEQVFGPEHLDTSRSLSALVELLADQQRYEQAEPFFQRILHICQQKLGSEHPDTIDAREQYTILLERINEQKKHNSSGDDMPHKQ